MSDLLTLSHVHVSYGAIHAVRGVDLAVRPHEMVTLIGCNGAGKSTLLRAISGLLPLREGTMTFLGEDISRLEPHMRVARGIVQVPEGRMIFPHMTVDENLRLGAYQRTDAHGIKDDRDFVFTLFPRVKERLHQMAGTLSGGEQQMLAIGRALMAKPKLLLLDEPSLGIAPILVQHIFSCLSTIHQRGVSMLLVEQDAHLALRTAQRGYVLETGEMLLSGDCQDLLHNSAVQTSYLGGVENG